MDPIAASISPSVTAITTPPSPSVTAITAPPAPQSVSAATSSSTVSSFYTSDLDAITAFVMRRNEFLDLVTDAVTYENTNPNASAMLELLCNNTFIPLISRLLNPKEPADVRSDFL